MHTHESTLRALGLSENEARVYLTMLTLPPLSIQQLTKKAPYSRTLLYYIMHQLLAHGLVEEIEHEPKARYAAVDPSCLSQKLASRERAFLTEQKDIASLIPTLRSLFKTHVARPTIETFQGIREYQRALDHVIDTKPSRIYAFEPLGTKRPGMEIRESHDAKRVAKKIKKDIVFFASNTARFAARKRPYDDHTRIREVTNKNIAPFNTDVVLFNDSLLYTTYTTREPIAILIEDAGLFTMHKSLFDALWSTATDRTLHITL